MEHFLEQVSEVSGLPLPMVFALTAALMSGVGVGLVLVRRDLAIKLSDFTTFLGGLILCGLAVFHLLPEAIETGRWLVLTGGVLFGLGLHFIAHQINQKPNQDVSTHYASAGIALLAIGLHSFLDGMVYAVTLDHDHVGGAFTGLGLILHETPEGILALMISLLIFKRSELALLVTLVLATFSTPVGTLTSLWVSETIGVSFYENAFPFSAGLIAAAGANLVYSGFQGIRKILTT